VYLNKGGNLVIGYLMVIVYEVIMEIVWRNKEKYGTAKLKFNRKEVDE